MVATLGTVATFGAQYWWALELTSHFRVQYAIALGVLAIAFALFRRWRTTTLVSCGAAMNLAVILPFYLPSSLAVPAGGPQLRVLLSNVNSANQQFDRLLAYIRRSQPDIIAVQEVNAAWNEALGTLAAEYPHRLAAIREDNFGILLLSKKPLHDAQILDLADMGAPALRAGVALGNHTVQLLTTHTFPPGPRGAVPRNRQLQAAADALNALPDPRLLIGDLNTTPWSPAYRQLVRATGLRNSAAGRGVQPTWPTMLPVLRIPIDHCLVSSELVVLEHTVGPDIGSDHYPLLVTLAVR